MAKLSTSNKSAVFRW